MKRGSPRWAATVLVTFLFATFPARAQDASPADPEAIARAYVADLAAGRWEQAAARHDQTMAGVMPAAKLAETWNGLLAQTGAFREIAGARRADAQGYRIVILTCRFANSTWNTRVVLDAAGLVSGLFFAPSRPAADWAAPTYAAPDRFTERSVTVGSGAWQLPGTLTLPKGSAPVPAVVLVHGSGPQDADETIGANKPFKDLAWGLASHGIAVLRYAKRTRQHGAALVTAFPELTVREETEDDAMQAVDLLATLPEIDRKRIYLAGHSLGAMLAPRIAGRSRNLAGIILLAGTTRPLDQVVTEQVRYLTSLDGAVTEADQKQIDAADQAAREIRSEHLTPRQTVHLLGAPIPGSYFLDLRAYHPAETAAKLTMPILVLQGERDYQVTMADFEGWRKALSGHSNVTFKTYPALNHLFIAGSGTPGPGEYNRPGHVDEQVVRDIAAWLVSGSLPR